MIFKNILHDSMYGNAVTMVVRVVLGAMYLFSGVVKALDPEAFAAVIRLYNILPGALVAYAAIVIPYVEIVLGLCLAAGYKVKAASTTSAGLMIVFSIAIAYNLLRGETFECGCFELKRLGLGFEERISYYLVFRDLALMACFILLYRVKKHVLSVEDYLERKGLRKLK